jgi:hypothetical protein
VAYCVGYDKLLFHERYTALRDRSRLSVFSAKYELNCYILFSLKFFCILFKFLHSTNEIIYRPTVNT